MAMNAQKVAVGGVAAGVVILALDFVNTMFVMGERFTAELEALNPSLAANMESTGALAGFAVVDIAFGAMLVWLYAAIRPRFGPGPKTAVYAGLYFWLLTGAVWASLAAIGMFSWGLYAMGGAAWLITSLAAAYVGGMIYTETA